MSLIYVGAIGATLVIDTGNKAIPLDGVITMVLESPSGVSTSIDVTNYLNIATGIINYPTQDGDVDEEGEYQVQLRGVWTGYDNPSNIGTFRVYLPLPLGATPP